MGTREIVLLHTQKKKTGTFGFSLACTWAEVKFSSIDVTRCISSYTEQKYPTKIQECIVLLAARDAFLVLNGCLGLHSCIQNPPIWLIGYSSYSATSSSQVLYCILTAQLHQV